MTRQRKPQKNPPSLAAFAEALNDTLTVRGVTKAELAERIGKSASAVGNWTRGTDSPSPETVFAIEDALQLAAGHLSRLLGFCPCEEQERPGVEEALLADPALRPEHKSSLLSLYRGLVAVT